MSTGLVLHNTLSRSKEPFEPLHEGRVGMYVCGPTVYDFAHIGNARPVVVFDVLYRLLKTLYGEVTYVRNITDVDDKIIKAAAENNEPIEALTARTTEVFHADMAALGALLPDIEPRATEHIPEMIELTKALVNKGHAYEKEGHVLFSVTEWDGYGKLSGNSRDEIVAGARVEVAPYKKDAADFVLWKPSEDDMPGWKTPWGRCRPGWHLECSAMSKKHLGDTFDIHGGGQDLIFSHHENEIAQSRCAHGTEIMAKYWMHNGYLMAEGEKMSKSLGNFYTVHDLLDEFPGEAIRLTLLKTHYRKPLDFTKVGIAKAKRELDGFYGALRRAMNVEAIKPKNANVRLEAFKEALCDDLNTPLALSHLHGRMNQLNLMLSDDSRGGKISRKDNKWLLLEMGKWLGLLNQPPEVWFKGPGAVRGEMRQTLPSLGTKIEAGVIRAEGFTEEEIEKRIEERNKARAEKDFAESDRIRDELAEAGVVLEDGADGTIWRRGD